MAKRTVFVSDFSGELVQDDDRTIIRVLDHADISSPVELDASASEADSLVKQAKSFVLLEVRRADQAPVRYALDQSDFDSASSSAMAEVLKQAPGVHEEAAPEPTRRRGRPRRAEGAPKPATRDYDIDALRAWARSNNVEIPQRGRIPQATVDRFKAEMDK